MTPKEDKELAAMHAALDALRKLQPEEQKRVLAWLAGKLKLKKSATDNGAGKQTLRQHRTSRNSLEPTQPQRPLLRPRNRRRTWSA